MINGHNAPAPEQVNVAVPMFTLLKFSHFAADGSPQFKPLASFPSFPLIVAALQRERPEHFAIQMTYLLDARLPSPPLALANEPR